MHVTRKSSHSFDIETTGETSSVGSTITTYHVRSPTSTLLFPRKHSDINTGLRIKIPVTYAINVKSPLEDKMIASQIVQVSDTNELVVRLINSSDNFYSVNAGDVILSFNVIEYVTLTVVASD